jgi:NADPH2:quinone reductase
MQALLPAGQPHLVGAGEVDGPAPGPGEAIIRVEAFSVNRGETFLLENPQPGWRPGKDIAGRVVAAAADGSGPAAGSRVVAHPPSGGWAQYAAADTGSMAELPPEISAVTAAALPLAGLTAATPCSP